jgi:hypothetical protein
MEFQYHHHNIAKHQVSTDEIEEAFSDPKGWAQRGKDGIYLFIGKTFAGRILEIVYRIEIPQTRFIFHAMDAREHQKKRYKQRS